MYYYIPNFQCQMKFCTYVDSTVDLEHSFNTDSLTNIVVEYFTDANVFYICHSRKTNKIMKLNIWMPSLQPLTLSLLEIRIKIFSLVTR